MPGIVLGPGTKLGNETELTSDFPEATVKLGRWMAHTGPSRGSVTHDNDCSEGNQQGKEDQGWAVLGVEDVDGFSEERTSEQNQE